MNELLDALLFPKECQDRGPDPGPFREHGSYKPYLQKVFRAKCVYCRTPDGLKGDDVFEVDHYLPQARFPHLRVTWSNLFYACRACNGWKGVRISTPKLFLPNPCEHRMADHLQYQGAYIESYTPHGDWLVELLRLNDRGRRERRELFLSSVGLWLKARNELLELLGDLVTFDAESEDARKTAEELEEELEKVERSIELLTGEHIKKASVA